jgi:hypothetical protein
MRSQPDDWPPSLPFRKCPKPYSRAIPWAPTDGRTTREPDRSSPYEMFVAQSVLRDVRSHLIGAPNPEPYGFLLGHVVYCPWTLVPYVVIDAVRRETHDVPHGGDQDVFRRTWAAASRDARRRRGQVIGWYHQHGVLGLRLSQWDLQLQEEFFPDAWHCALLIVPGVRGPIGGFVQRSGRARLYRRGISGFYELVDLDAKSINGKKPSVVDWTNHRPAERVEIQRVEWPGPRRRRAPDPKEAKEDPEPGAGADITPLRAQEPQLELDGDAAKPLSSDWRPTGGAGLRAQRPWKTRKTRKTRKNPVKQVVGPDEPDLAKGFADAVGKPSVEAEERDASEDEKTSGGNGAPSPLNVDEREVAHFMEAVWGPAPYEAEEDEASVTQLPGFRELLPLEGPEMLSAADVASALTIPPPLEARLTLEPPETDSAEGSVDWLLGLAEQSLGVGLAASPREAVEADAATAEPQPEEVDEPEAPEVEADASGASPEPVTTPGEDVPPPSGEDISVRQPRIALVGTGEDPEEDPEAAIPFVMPQDEGHVLLGFGRQRRRPLLLALVVLVAALTVWFFTGRGDPTGSGFQAPAAATTQPARSVELAAFERQFTAAVASYRERGADFLLARIDCAALRAGLVAVEGAFAELSGYVARVPAEATDYWMHAREMREATEHFAASGCEGADSGSPEPVP